MLLSIYRTPFFVKSTIAFSNACTCLFYIDSVLDQIDIPKKPPYIVPRVFSFDLLNYLNRHLASSYLVTYCVYIHERCCVYMFKYEIDS